jgi:hypothetical protein
MQPAKTTPRRDTPPSSAHSILDDSEPADDPFANIGHDQVEDSAEVSETSIPVDFGTPSLHMEEEEEDVFAKLGQGAVHVEPQETGTGAPGSDEPQPIDRVEQAANDLFDSLGIQHAQAGQDRFEGEGAIGSTHEPPNTGEPITDSAAVGAISGESDKVAARQEVAVEQEATTPKQAGIDLVTTPLQSSQSVEDVGEPEVTHSQGPSVEAQDTTARPESPIQLQDDTDPDDIYATLASGGAEDDDRSTGFDVSEQSASTSPRLHRAASQIELVETEADGVFDNLGSTEEQEPESAEVVDSVEEQERKYQLLLEEFAREAGDDEIQGSGTDAPAAADLFGGEADSTPFDDLIPSEEHDFLQTASSSTTPPSLSIENSLQDIEPYDAYGDEGEVSMMAESSDWLGDSSMDAEQPYRGHSAEPEGKLSNNDAGASSQVDIEVPYGWYEGDTFHYYTEEQRELVRATMMEQHQQSSGPEHALVIPDQGKCGSSSMGFRC